MTANYCHATATAIWQRSIYCHNPLPNTPPLGGVAVVAVLWPNHAMTYRHCHTLLGSNSRLEEELP